MSENERLTSEKLNAIRERADKATPGPWRTKYNAYKFFTQYEVIGEAIVGRTAHDFDAEFIANARQDVPELLAEVERLRKSHQELVNSYASLFVDYVQLMDAYIPGWRAYAVKELTSLMELITNASEKV